MWTFGQICVSAPGKAPGVTGPDSTVPVGRVEAKGNDKGKANGKANGRDNA